ncbi:hypothetical protein [Halobaculum litoreum]|uniref:hypothetical protein n=1 Tax=Halobaculum litoreum TaxID=3031998 RepID=UPI0024C31B32|nr:hypothetical protein [Halobaculum sp. DT92]
MTPTGDTDGDVAAVRATLRALATGDRRGRDDERSRRLVADAERALESVAAAAAFAEAGGFDRLRGIVADGGGADRSVARRARAVLDAVAAFRTAYRDSGDAAGDARGVAGRNGDGDADGADAADHFRPTHDSHIPGAALPDDQ